MGDPVTYWERRQAGEFERAAAERAADQEAFWSPEQAAIADDDRVHIPIGSDVELDEAIDTGGGGASSLTGLSDVTGEPGPGKGPVADDSGMFPLVPVTTHDDLQAVLDQVATVTWHDIGGEGEPPFQSAFRNIGDPWAPARYRHLANSTVRLSGTICCDDQTIGGATWVPIFTLPPEVTPDYNLEFAALTNDEFISKVYVWSDGQVVWAGYAPQPPNPPAVSRLPLNAISWSTKGPPQ